MAASKYDFSIEQGSSFKLAIIYKDKNKNVVDLSNWCAKLVWKTDKGSTQVFSSDNSDTTLYSLSIDGPNGKLTLLLPSDTTNSLNFYSAKYDLELQSPNLLYSDGGKYSTRLLYGNVSIIKRFSQSDQNINC